MAQLPWHDYNGESAEQLLALAATHRLDSLAVAFEMAIQQKAATLGDEALSVPERDVLAIEALEREVNNGGYGQFFLNPSNEYASTIVGALQRIGCVGTAAITEQALAALPNGVELSSSALEAEMLRDDEERDSRLEACNDAYYGGNEDIATALIGYLHTRSSEIRLL